MQDQIKMSKENKNNDSTEKRTQRLLHLPASGPSDHHFLSRGNSVSNIPWWVIALIGIILIFLLMFIAQYAVQLTGANSSMH